MPSKGMAQIGHIAALLMAVFAASSAVAEPRHGSMSVLHRVPLEAKAVALTVDLGVSARPGALEGIFASLEKRDVRVTWFVTGWFVRNHGDLLDRMAERGDHFANHTDTHPDCTRVSMARIHRELRTVEELMAVRGLDITAPKHFRPPFGRHNRTVVAAASELGYRTVHWSATTDDYTPGRDATSAARAILRRVEPGGIILIHATNVSRWLLPTLLDELDARGYEVMPLVELLGMAHREMAERSAAAD